MQLGFHQSPPPRRYKNSLGQAGSDPQAWPSFAAPSWRGSEWPLSLNLGFVIFPCCFGRLFVDWPSLSVRICSLTSSPLLGKRVKQKDPLSLLVTSPKGLGERPVPG